MGLRVPDSSSVVYPNQTVGLLKIKKRPASLKGVELFWRKEEVEGRDNLQFTK